ncbi:class I SAM-dependent methyltransferase [uncultured Streptomyces sp.]|uniref:class I SAM-dependent methyltransferase n=1 Tax=uncultured Streptomyces sp. TaxID=174707 RepID=UPI002628481E|nr:class I SAM-dependent methyltransferase [uncultured Streptomyces sp.]
MTEASYLAAVRNSYDAVAADYAVLVPDPTELDPVSRAMLAAFAELVRAGGPKPVADLGCGPGKVTAHLAGLGLTAFGVDVSPAMAVLAREAHPGLPFWVGTMTALALADDVLGGILAHYSTHHTPPDLLPRVFAEFHRTLAPGGHLLLAGHVGSGERRRPARAYGGHPVSYESHRLSADVLAGLLADAGLVVTARTVQDPDDDGRWRVAGLLARKPLARKPPARKPPARKPPARTG